jgi:hypothetical protein
MRWLTVIIATGIVLFAACYTTASADTDSEMLSFLDGGSLSTDVRISLGFLYGAGCRPDGLGNPVSTVRGELVSVCGNPAGLAFLESSGVLIDVLPPLGASVSDLADLNTRAASMLDDALESADNPELELTYPEVDATAGQQAGIVSGVFAARIGRVVIGGAIEEPLSVGFEIVDTGIEAFGETVKDEEGGDVDIAVRATLDAAADLSVSVRRSTLAAATQLSPKIGVGFALNSYHASAGLTSIAVGDGIMDYGGTEYAFNNPDDPWNNRLDQSASGSFEGAALGWSAGASWRITRSLTFDVNYTTVPDVVMEGSVTIIENMLAAISDDGFDANEISASQPTLTEYSETIEDDPLHLHLPSHMGAAVSLRTGIVLTTLEYRHYDGMIGFAYQDYSEGVLLGDGIGMELEIGRLRLGGGVITAELQGKSANDNGSNAILIPLANVGMGFELGGGMRADTMFLALPLQVLRVSLSYQF